MSFVLTFAARKPTLAKWVGRFYSAPRTRPTAKEARDSKFPPSEVLPKLVDWRTLFPRQGAQNRYSLSNPATAATLADKFVPLGSRDKVIIEAFPGPGALTRALLALPKKRIKKLIVMEDNPDYLAWLRPLEKLDSRIVILPKSAYHWTTYDEMKELGLVDDVTKHPWGEGVHPQLQFVSHLPVDVLGEQLIAQLLRGIPDEQWLFQYGRVPMSFILTDHVYKRLTTDFGAEKVNIRCKLTIIAEATAEVELVVKAGTLEQCEEHFHPAAFNHQERPFQAVNITPLAEPFIGKDLLEKWDFCLRRLYVLKGQPVRKVLSSLAPGAANLIKVIDNPQLSPENRLDTTKQIRYMTIQDWQILVKAFDEWPFAPDDLQISDVLVAKDEPQNRRSM